MYRIQLIGVVDEGLVERLGGLQVTRERNEAEEEISTLTGVLADQAALIGVLVQLYNRGFCLLSLSRAGVAPLSA